MYFDDDSTLRMTNQEERQRSIDLAKKCKQFLSSKKLPDVHLCTTICYTNHSLDSFIFIQEGKEFEKVVDSVLRDTKQLAANVDVQEKKAIGQNIKFKN